MILLDSDHMTALRYQDHPRCAALNARLQAAEDPVVATTIVCAEEQMRGWLAEIHRTRDLHEQVAVYARLGRLFSMYESWTVVPFDAPAADEFLRLRAEKVRIGSQDLKIASVVLVHAALLLTANARDFKKVPGLRFENWLE